MSERDPRERMVEHDLIQRGITDERVITAMREVPREDFVPDDEAGVAYGDHPLPIGHDQTISQPYMVALMAQEARVGPHDTVLEIGTGSGYGAAVLSKLARRVVTVERIPELADSARTRLENYPNVEVHTGDGSAGWPEAAPYRAIVVTAAAEDVPDALTDQLDDEARLVIPVGPRGRTQELLVIRSHDGRFRRDRLGGVAFVPLIADDT